MNSNQLRFHGVRPNIAIATIKNLRYPIYNVYIFWFSVPLSKFLLFKRLFKVKSLEPCPFGSGHKKFALDFVVQN